MLPKLQSVINKWILHQETSAPSGHYELVKVKQAPPEARLRQLSPSKGKCAWGCTISLLLAFQSNPESPWTVTKGKDHFVVFPVAPPRPCCAHTWQSKRPLSVQIVHSRICDNLLSSLFMKWSGTRQRCLHGEGTFFERQHAQDSVWCNCWSFWWVRVCRQNSLLLRAFERWMRW